MTSQLVLANGFGVAVASDSAVTVGDRVRTYEDVEKIHPLADPHRLAVLQSGSVNLLSMPVSVMLQDWRNSLGARQRTVEGYRDNFLTWLQDNLDNWTTSTERDGAAWLGLDAELRDLAELVEEAVSPIPKEKHLEEALRIIREQTEEFSRFDVYDQELLAMADELLDRLSQEGADDRPPLSKLVEKWFGEFGSDEINQEVHRFFKVLFGRVTTIPNRNSTFLTFVGYGANDLLPHMSQVWLEGAVGNHLCHLPWPIRKAHRRGSSYVMIEPLAQTDMIELILYGWDRRLAEDAKEATFERTKGGERKPADPPLTTGGDDIRGDQGDAVDQYDAASTEEDWRSVLIDETRNLAWRRSGKLAFETIASLPLSSLANAAKSLVTIQNLAQNIRGELPTVGGKINVATITLSNGFQWVSGQDDD